MRYSVGRKLFIFKLNFNWLPMSLKTQNRLYKYLVNNGGYLYQVTEKIEELKRAGDNQSSQEAANIGREIQILARKILNDVIVVHVYFKELGIVKYSKDEFYGIADAISN